MHQASSSKSGSETPESQKVPFLLVKRIREAILVTESHDFDLIIKKLALPDANPFERIFILHVTPERGDGYRALEFFPSVQQFLSD